MQIPIEYRNFIQTVYGDQGRQWVDHLPVLLTEFARRWDLEIQQPFLLSYNYVAPAIRSGSTPVVVKASLPGNYELQTEIAALQTYGGSGMVKLLEAVPEQGIFLLERVLPGQPLKDLADDEQSTRIAAQVMRRIWRPIPPENVDSFPTAAKWAKGMERLRAEFGGGTGPFPKDKVERAESLFRDLLASQGAPVLLHGDLHHWNILSAEREPWLAIDPKGLIGEAEYEPGALFRNPIPMLADWPDLPRVQDRRAAILCEMLGFDRQRVLGWAYAQAILSAWWSYEEEKTVWSPWLAVADSLEAVMV